MFILRSLGIIQANIISFIFNQINAVNLLGKTSTAIGSQATTFLQSLSSLRLFISRGPGFGDQVCALNILDNLQKMGFKGQVEIIADSNLYPNQLSAMAKIQKLLNIAEPKLNTTIINKLEVKLISDQFFKANINQFAEADLGVFVSTADILISSFGKKPLPEMAKAAKAIHFDSSSTNSVGSGFVLQLQHQKPLQYLSAKVLPLKIEPPSEVTITQELAVIAQQHPMCGNTLSQLLNKTAEHIRSFAIYGLAPSFDSKPELKLLNLIIAASKTHNPENIPLQVMIMNSISDQSWYNLQQLFHSDQLDALKIALQQLQNNKIAFVDLRSNQTEIVSSATMQITVFRMPELPRGLFYRLFSESTVPPVYEGTNTAGILENVKRYGLPCRRPDWPMPSDSHKLPWELASASNFVCTANDLDLWNSYPTPDQKLTPIMDKYALGKQSRPPIGDIDRVSYAISQLSTKEDCNQNPSACAFVKAWQNPSRVINLVFTTSMKGLFFTGSQVLAEKVLVKKFNVEPEAAISCSSFLRTLLQFCIERPEESQEAMIIFLICTCNFFASIASLDKNRELRLKVEAGKTMLYVVYFYLLINSKEVPAVLLIGALALIASVAEFSVRLGIEKTSSYFFPPPKKNPNSEVAAITNPETVKETTKLKIN